MFKQYQIYFFICTFNIFACRLAKNEGYAWMTTWIVFEGSGLIQQIYQFLSLFPCFAKEPNDKACKLLMAPIC